MQAIIGANTIKLFSKVIKCLQKIGEDALFEALPNQLNIRTLNANRSAFFAFLWNSMAFESYLIEPGKEAVIYKILLKPLLNAFKSVANVERCVLRISDEDPKLVVEMNCNTGVKKTFTLNVECTEPVQAVYSKQECHSKLVCRPIVLDTLASKFMTSLEEVTLNMLPTKLTLASFFQDTSKAEKQVLTEIDVEATEFDKYELGVPSLNLTFSLKDIRTALTFCPDQPLTLYLEDPGKPILMNTKIHNILEADFVMASLALSNDATQESQTQHHHSLLSNACSTPSEAVRNPKKRQSGAVTGGLPESPSKRLKKQEMEEVVWASDVVNSVPADGTDGEIPESDSEDN